MKVSSVTAPDAASDPAHPDHDRWFKDTTLKMEIEHAKRLGIPLRHAEAENVRLLELHDRTVRESRPVEKRKPKPVGTPPQEAHRGVIRRPARPEKIKKVNLSPCGHCGTCRACRRTSRTMAIIHRRKETPALDTLALRMFVAALQAQSQIGKFKGLTKRDADRALTVEIESICDESVRQLGAWV